jgi:hypothetical protein
MARQDLQRLNYQLAFDGEWKGRRKRLKVDVPSFPWAPVPAPAGQPGGGPPGGEGQHDSGPNGPTCSHQMAGRLLARPRERCARISLVKEDSAM